MLTRAIHTGNAYHAAVIDGPRGGLCVTRNLGHGGGILLRQPAAAEWIAAIESESDYWTREALCRAVLTA